LRAFLEGHRGGKLAVDHWKRRDLTVDRQGNLGQGDIVCRLGGEEFLILMMGASAGNARIKIDKYREDFSKITIRYQSSALKITFSAGIAVYPDHTENAKKLLDYADLALYAAKHNGRNRVSIFS
jgi:two-component system cell cycle response regulator